MLFIALLTSWTQSQIMCTLSFPARSDLFYWWLNTVAIPVMDHWTINWICLPDCPPQSISILPATTLERSDANACGVFVLSFPSLKNDMDTGESFPPWGSHCHLRCKCLGSRSQWGVIHVSDTGASIVGLLGQTYFCWSPVDQHFEKKKQQHVAKSIHVQVSKVLVCCLDRKLCQEETFGSLISTNSFQRQEWKKNTKDNKHHRQVQLAIFYFIYLFFTGHPGLFCDQARSSNRVTKRKAG